MRMSRLFLAVWLLTAALIVGSAPWLPAQVGDPGKAMSRTAFIVTMLLPLATALLCSKAFVTWLGRVAPGQVKLPHRDYWMAEPRREATLARVGEHVAGLGVMVLLMSAGSHVVVLLDAHPDWPQPPQAVGWCLGALWLAGLASAVWRLHQAFPAPPTDEATPRRRPRRPGAHD
ncbi:MAG: hypothetical protein EKK53_01210 [Burkholderiales bacterium]|nr:MAG: hypothetical protein EKK53_01210 [Burkholderiales bacterium]